MTLMLTTRIQKISPEGVTPSGVEIFSVFSDRSLFCPESSFEDYGLVMPESIKKACIKRQSDYLAGRYCASNVLKALGKEGVTYIASAEDRSPVWPQGYTGSVSHSENIAVAAACHHSSFQSLGIDIEFHMKEKTLNSVCEAISIAQERSAESVPSGLTRSEYFTLVFSAKESIFKAIHPLTKVFFGFSDARVFKICPESGTFSFKLLTDLSERFYFGYEGKGNFFQGYDFVFTSVFIP